MNLGTCCNPWQGPWRAGSIFTLPLRGAPERQCLPEEGFRNGWCLGFCFPFPLYSHIPVMLVIFYLGNQTYVRLNKLCNERVNYYCLGSFPLPASLPLPAQPFKSQLQDFVEITLIDFRVTLLRVRLLSCITVTPLSEEQLQFDGIWG